MYTTYYNTRNSINTNITYKNTYNVVKLLSNLQSTCYTINAQVHVYNIIFYKCLPTKLH